MKKRWNANTWVLAVLGAILLLVGIDVGRRMIAGPAPAEAPKPVSAKPDFKIGDPAPDFTFPDEKKQPRKLSELVKRDTLLTFSCGCNQCREFQTWTGKIMKTLGKRAPEVISVNTTQPDSAEAWKRDTGLQQVMLYGSHSQGPAAPYHGSPCPRSFLIGPDRKVKWIGGSRNEGRMVQQLGMELAQALDADGEGRLPKMEWQSDRMPMAPPVPPAQGGGGHSADDGHGHG